MLKHATRNIFISRIVRPYRYKLFDVRIKLGLTPLNAVSIHLSHFRPAVEGPNPTTYKSIHSEQNLTWPLSQINHLIIECPREFAGPSWDEAPWKYEITDPLSSSSELKTIEDSNTRWEAHFPLEDSFVGNPSSVRVFKKNSNIIIEKKVPIPNEVQLATVSAYMKGTFLRDHFHSQTQILI